LGSNTNDTSNEYSGSISKSFLLFETDIILVHKTRLLHRLRLWWAVGELPNPTFPESILASTLRKRPERSMVNSVDMLTSLWMDCTSVGSTKAEIRLQMKQTTFSLAYW